MQVHSVLHFKNTFVSNGLVQ